MDGDASSSAAGESSSSDAGDAGDTSSSAGGELSSDITIDDTALSPLSGGEIVEARREEDDDEDVYVDIVGEDAGEDALEDQVVTDTEMEIEEESDTSAKESTPSDSSSFSLAAALAFVFQQSFESDAGLRETAESRIFRNLPPSFPVKFLSRIEDPKSICPRILMEKALRRSDVDEEQNRLAIPARKVREAFLLPEEEERLGAGGHVEVALIEPDGETVSAGTLVRRRIGVEEEGRSYLVTGEWNQVVERNGDAVKLGERIRVWYFRGGGGRLWFAIEGGIGEDGEVKELAEKWWGQNIFAP